MGEYSYILEQQGKTTSEKLAEFTAAIGWRDELATYRIAQDEYDMRAAAAAEQGISLLDEPPYTEEELAALDAESAAYYDAFAANYVATAAFTGSGSGTQSDPYIITNRAELEAIADDLTAYYQLANDIDLGGSGSPWTPIGSQSAPFGGTLDGDGYTLSNLYISGGVYSGLFSVIGQNANIKQIQFLNPTIIDAEQAGAVSGMGLGNTNNFAYVDSIAVSGLTISNAIASKVFPHGGIVGNTGYVYLSNCVVSDSDISGTYSGSNNWAFVGGIAGHLYTSTNIRNCYVIDTQITASGGSKAYAGGIGVLVDSTLIQKCVVIDSPISAPSANRILGVNKGASGGFISDNYATTTTTVNGNVVSGGTITNTDGADVSASTYNTQAFWQNTLGWDFDTVWYWDTATNLPLLRVFFPGPIPMYPLNVEIGSPQYTTVSQINYSVGEVASVQVTPTTSGTTPVNNSYYTFQSQDGQKWMTAYVGNWTNNGGTWTADIVWSSSNTDTLPAQSICWCVWTKEYYDSLIAQIGGGGGGGAVIKSIEYDLPTTTFTITDTNDQVTEINTSPSVAGADHPPYNLSGIFNDHDGTPALRMGYSTGSSVSNVSDMVVVSPVLSQTHEIYFDVSGTDLYVRRESPAGMYELFNTNGPIEEGKDSVVVPWKMCDVIRFHIPEDNFGSNYTVNISCNPVVEGWMFMYLDTDSHVTGELSLGGNDELPRSYLHSTSNIFWIYYNARDYSQSELSSAYEIREVTISISRRSTGVPEVS